MARTTLLKRVEDLELWTTVGDTAQSFAVSVRRKRLRVVTSLEKAEALFAKLLRDARIARAH